MHTMAISNGCVSAILESLMLSDQEAEDPIMLMPALSDNRESVRLLALKAPDSFEDFLADVELDLLSHPVIKRNPYTRWFSKGEATVAELRHFAVQFSVFSNQFLIAQLKKMINADSLESMRAAKEILANEIGVVFNGRSKANPPLSELEKDRQGDPELVSCSGSVDGGRFYFRAGHFEWLLKFGEALGLTFTDLGRRHHASPSTLFYVDELIRLYGSEDATIATGASFAVESWATLSNFWQELEDGLIRIQDTRMPQLRIAFFTWHNRIEAQHVGHIHDELKAFYDQPGFDQARFMEAAMQALDAINAFWVGLEEDRLRGHSA